MGSAPTSELRGRTHETVSTGKTVKFPVGMESTIDAVVLAADRKRTAELLPESMTPIRAGPGRAAVWLMTAQHRNVGNGSFDPYDEFAVLISATPGQAEGIPYLSPLWRTEAYVWYMPVTTESARRYGEELWGFPKTVGDIDIHTKAGRRKTSVSVNDEHLLSFELSRPPTIKTQNTITNYTVKDGHLLRIQAETDGQIGMWPYTTDFSVSFGDHERADTLRDLNIRSRAIARFHFRGQSSFPAGTPVQD